MHRGAVAGALGGFGATAGAFYGAGTSGIIGGAITGGVGSVVGGIVEGSLNALYFHDKINSDNWAQSVVYGAVGGAFMGGAVAAWQGRNLFTGLPKGGGINATSLVSTNEHRRALLKSGDWGVNKFGALKSTKVLINELEGQWLDDSGRSFKIRGDAERIAFGVREHLGPFGEHVGATPYFNWAENAAMELSHVPTFEKVFMQKINNPNISIDFDLTLGNGTMMNVWKSISNGMGAGGRVTEWELYQIFTNSSALSRTTFWFRGSIVNPF